MRIGRWRGKSHQGIAFDEHGRLADGQHRLLAVVEAGVAVEMNITTMMPDNVIPSIDLQKKRSLADAMGLSGRRECLGGKGSPTNTSAGMWRAMEGGLQYGMKARRTHEQLLAFADAHRSAGVFALAEFSKHPRIKSIHVAPVLAAVARAYYIYRDSTPKLQRFVQLLCTGMGTSAFSHEDTVLKFRNLVINTPRIRNSNAAGEIYGKTCVAIRAYMEGRTLKKFYEPSEEPFPLPGDTATAGRPDRMAFDDAGSRAGRSRVGSLVAHPA
jgi:hypothetical protein